MSESETAVRSARERSVRASAVRHPMESADDEIAARSVTPAVEAIKVLYVHLDPVTGDLQPYTPTACKIIEEGFRDFLLCTDPAKQRAITFDASQLVRCGLPKEIAPLVIVFHLHHDVKHPMYDGIILIDQLTKVDLDKAQGLMDPGGEDGICLNVREAYTKGAVGFRNVRRHHIDALGHIGAMSELSYGKLLVEDSAGNDEGDTSGLDNQRYRLARHRFTKASELVKITVQHADLADVPALSEAEQRAFDEAEEPLRRMDTLRAMEQATAAKAAEAAAEAAAAAAAVEVAAAEAAAEAAAVEAKGAEDTAQPAARAERVELASSSLRDDGGGGADVSAVVFGSLNVDVRANARMELPSGDATGTGELHQSYGGKGANEAVALSRQGVRTKLVGRVGQDTNGRDLLAHLTKEGVDVAYVDATKSKTTSTVRGGRRHPPSARDESLNPSCVIRVVSVSRPSR